MSNARAVAESSGVYSVTDYILLTPSQHQRVLGRLERLASAHDDVIEERPDCWCNVGRAVGELRLLFEIGRV